MYIFGGKNTIKFQLSRTYAIIIAYIIHLLYAESWCLLEKKEIIQKIIENNGGIAKTSDFAAKGINKCEVATLCKE